MDGSRAHIWLEPAEGKDRKLTAAGRNHWQPRLAHDAASFVHLTCSSHTDQGSPAPDD